MVGWSGVTGNAIRRPCSAVVKLSISPIRRVMTGRALPVEMVVGFVVTVTGDAIRYPGRAVVELSVTPIGGVMAG